MKKGGLTTAAYSYDGNGNRSGYTGPGGTVTGTYDGRDRLTQYGPTAYTYTPSGELATRVSGGQTTSYDYYDVFGNLTDVVLPGATRIKYHLDGQHRRIGKEVDGTLIKGFLYQDQFHPVAELDGSGNLVSRFVYATKDNVPDYLVKNGVVYRIDQRSSGKSPGGHRRNLRDCHAASGL